MGFFDPVLSFLNFFTRFCLKLRLPEKRLVLKIVSFYPTVPVATVRTTWLSVQLAYNPSL